MPVEEIIKEMKKQDKIISEAQKEKQKLYEQLETADCDWISVKQASRILDVSEGLIYNKINSGKLQSKRIESVVRVRKSEILAINDQ